MHIIQCNVIESRLVQYAHLYVKKQATYLPNLDESSLYLFKNFTLLGLYYSTDRSQQPVKLGPNMR